MSRRRLFSSFVASLAILSLQVAPAHADGKDEILKIIPTIDAAIKTHDFKTLSTIFDPEGKFVTETGETQDQKKYLRSLSDPTITFKSAKSSYTSLRVFGDTAVELGTFNATGMQKGKPLTVAVRYMSVWVKKNGKWVVTAEQSTAVSKPK